jgi:hypothetical protein
MIASSVYLGEIKGRVVQIVSRCPALLYLAVFLACYSPSFMTKYLWSDEFSYESHLSGLRSDLISNLRPTYALLTYGSTIFGSEKIDFQLARVLAIVGLSFFAQEIHYLYKSLNRFSVLFICVALGLLTIPFQNWIYFGVCAPFSWAAFLSMRGIRKWTSEKKLIKKIFGIVPILLSYGIYPLATLAPLGIYYIRDLIEFRNFEFRRRIWRNLRIVRLLLTSGALSVAIFSAISKVVNDKVAPRTIPKSVTEIVNAIYFNLTHNLVQSFRIYWMDSPSTWIGFSEIIFVTLLLLLCLKNLRRQANWLGVFAEFGLLTSIIMLMLFPTWIVGYSQIELRFLAGTTFVPTFIIYWSIAKCSKRPILRLTSTLKRSIFIVMSIATASIFSYSSYFVGVQPITRNTSKFLEAEFLNCSREKLLNGVIIVERKFEFPQRKFLGMYSQSTDLASPWVPEPAVRAYLRNSFEGVDKLEVETVNKILKSYELKCIVDLNRFDMKSDYE